MQKKIITFGELMLRLSPPLNLRFSQASTFDVMFGGSEANVAVTIAGFGGNVSFVSRMPENDISRTALMSLKRYDVATNDILFGGDRLGVYYLENGASLRGSKVIYDRENSAMSQLQPGMIDWEKIFENASWFHWSGITPAISDSAAKACAEAIEIANNKGIIVSTDLNYRNKLWKYGKKAEEVMPDLVAGCDVILGDVDTCERLFGIKVAQIDTSVPLETHELEPWCKEVQKVFPKAKKIISSLRHIKSASENKYAGVMYGDGQFYQSAWYNISNIVDRVGTGDSFMGGLIYKLAENMGQNQEALDFAVATAVLKHTVSGDFNVVTKDEVEALKNGAAAGKISR